MVSVLADVVVMVVAPVNEPPRVTFPFVLVNPFSAVVSTETAGVEATPFTVEVKPPLTSTVSALEAIIFAVLISIVGAVAVPPMTTFVLPAVTDPTLL
jgi:hypothetical protein